MAVRKDSTLDGELVTTVISMSFFMKRSKGRRFCIFDTHNGHNATHSLELGIDITTARYTACVGEYSFYGHVVSCSHLLLSVTELTDHLYGIMITVLTSIYLFEVVVPPSHPERPPCKRILNAS